METNGQLHAPAVSSRPKKETPVSNPMDRRVDTPRSQSERGAMIKIPVPLGNGKRITLADGSHFTS
jgi:hypothetical protein